MNHVDTGETMIIYSNDLTNISQYSKDKKISWEVDEADKVQKGDCRNSIFLI